jgi:hypothetical protein
MVAVSIKMTGYVQVLDKVKLLGAGAEAVNGPIASFGSRLSYARFIETGRSSRPQVRRAGPARMFELGVAEAAKQAPALLAPAIPRGPAAVGAAKRRIRDIGLERIRALTPVRSGKLRASVSELNRPGIG